jgi:N utilization substance protein B
MHRERRHPCRQLGGHFQKFTGIMPALPVLQSFSFRNSTRCCMVCERMGKRREARERAVQFLFQHDLNPPADLDRALDEFWESQRAAAIAEEKGPATWGQEVELPPPSTGEAEMRLFAEPLIRGTVRHRDEADEHIKKHVKNWELHRIAAVDRNILRLAIYEMLHRDDIPPVVSINEAVDIAKKFSTQDSGKFVNGILDKVKGELMRPARIVK